ncbi:MAG: DUF4932 domain-containing protein [Prevotellaceae bacterium]|jgi:hypothetical protein|nr:DUF4932 domain-containing protein [Prevotellaceae bacterium]
MKKKLICILIFANCILVFAQKNYNPPQVDERVELMSIVFRLAGADEYSTSTIPLYVNEIDNHFEKYKKHSLIEFTKKLREKDRISFDAVVDLAISLKVKNNKIEFNKYINIETLDDRWDKDSIPKYIKLLNNFYKKTKFHNFFISNKKTYSVTEKNFAKNVTDEIDFDWFEQFFKKLPAKDFNIIIHLNGWHNYGPKVIYEDGSEEFYAIMSSDKADKDGFPTFEYKYGRYDNTLIHEICHSFCDSYISEYADQLLPQATIFYNLYRDQLTNMYCVNPYDYLGEIFVRACVLQYQKDHNRYNKYDLKNEVYSGFLWLPQLLDALEKYAKDTNYTTFNDFMPEILNLQNSLNPQELYREIAKITDANIENGNDSVDYNLDHISLHFSLPVLFENDTISRYFYIQPKMDFTKKDNWNNDATELTFFVKLEPDTQYRIFIPYATFEDVKKRFYLKNDYVLVFKTRKK